MISDNQVAGAGAKHNWIHDNTFTISGQSQGTGGLGCTDGGNDILDIGRAGGNSQDNYNTIENNVFARAPHAAIDQFGMYNVFRNNVFHNEPWSAGCSVVLESPDLQ